MGSTRPMRKVTRRRPAKVAAVCATIPKAEKA
jgi:hypothetical protein